MTSELFKKSYDKTIASAQKRRKAAAFAGKIWNGVKGAAHSVNSSLYSETLLGHPDEAVDSERYIHKARILSNFKTLASTHTEALQAGQGIKITSEGAPKPKSQFERVGRTAVRQFSKYILGREVAEEADAMFEEPQRVSIGIDPVFSRYRKRLRGWNVQMSNSPSEYQLEHTRMLTPEEIEEYPAYTVEGTAFEDSFYVGRDGSVYQTDASHGGNKNRGVLDPNYKMLDARFGVVVDMVIDNPGETSVQTH